MKTDRASSKHGSILGGNFPRKRVKSQWKSTLFEHLLNPPNPASGEHAISPVIAHRRAEDGRPRRTSETIAKSKPGARWGSFGKMESRNARPPRITVWTLLRRSGRNGNAVFAHAARARARAIIDNFFMYNTNTKIPLMLPAPPSLQRPSRVLARPTRPQRVKGPDREFATRQGAALAAVESG